MMRYSYTHTSVDIYFLPTPLEIGTIIDGGTYAHIVNKEHSKIGLVKWSGNLTSIFKSAKVSYRILIFLKIS